MPGGMIIGRAPRSSASMTGPLAVFPPFRRSRGGRRRLPFSLALFSAASDRLREALALGELARPLRARRRRKPELPEPGLQAAGELVPDDDQRTGSAVALDAAVRERRVDATS